MRFGMRQSRGVRYFIYLEGGEESREDGSDRSIGGVRLVREHVSGVGEVGGRKYGVQGCLFQGHGFGGDF